MTKYITKDIDISDYMDDINDAIIYLNKALDDDVPELLFLALADVVKKRKSMTELSKETGLSREGLYKILSGKGNPTISSLLKIIKSLNITLKFSKSIT